MTIEVANRLTNLRKKKAMSQEEVAELLGISRQAVSRWERAESAPDMDNLIQLSHIYEISLDELLNINIGSNNNGTDMQQETECLAKEDKQGKPDSVITQVPFPFVIPVYIIWGMFGFHEGYNWLGKHTPNAMQRFPFPIIVVFIYLIIGFLFKAWHPSWILFLLVPLYYVIAALIKGK